MFRAFVRQAGVHQMVPPRGKGESEIIFLLRHSMWSGASYSFYANSSKTAQPSSARGTGGILS
jgi:hypothetical protein